jgi:hypothetical protein
VFTRLKIDDNFLVESPSSWPTNVLFLKAKNAVSTLTVVGDIAERGVKRIQDFHGLIIITVEEEQKQFLLRYVQEYKRIFLDFNKKL